MTRPPFALQAVGAVAITAVLSLALRWDAIAYSGMINPDEAEILAAGRRAAMELWMPMGTASANTYFPLWPTSLGVLDVLGFPLDLRFAHLLSAACYAAVISMVWIATARRWGWIWPAIFIAPPAYWMLTWTGDFMQLGTELPPVVLLVLGAVVAFPPDKAVSARRLAVVAGIASLAPWFKPQTGPLAVTLVISACGFAYLVRDGRWSREEWRRRAAWLVAGGLAPTVFLVLLMLAGGTLGLFWDEPVAFLRAYLTHSIGELGVGASTAPLPDKLHQLWRDTRANALAFSWLLIGLRGWRLGTLTPARRCAYIAVWLAPVVGALATLLVQWPVFPHYLNLLYGGTAIAAIAGSGLATAPEPVATQPTSSSPLPSRRGRVLEATALASVVLSVLTVYTARVVPPPGVPPHQGSPDLAALCPAEESVQVWGWAAELYSYYDWQPASRYVTYAFLKAVTPQQQDYQARFRDELADAPPRCIVNAVGPAWFGSNPDDPPIEAALPETRPWLERCYTQQVVAFSPEDQISVWSRKDGC